MRDGDLFVDSTSLKRSGAEHRSGEQAIVVDAGVGPEIDFHLVEILDRVVNGQRPLKWAGVCAFVLTDRSAEASRVRERLTPHPIVITDPLEGIRRVEVRLARENQTGPVLIPLLASTRKDHRAGREIVAGFVRQSLLDASAVPVLENLLSQASLLQPLRRIDGRPATITGSTDLRSTILSESGGSIKKLAMLAGASQSLVLHGGADADDETLAMFPEVGAARRLSKIGRSRIVFDEGQRFETTGVDRLRMAVVTAANSITFGRVERGGFVRPSDDRSDVRLQLADIVAGFASAVLLSKGMVGLAQQFPAVVYNGRRLDLDSASAFDRDRAAFRRLSRG